MQAILSKLTERIKKIVRTFRVRLPFRQATAQHSGERIPIFNNINIGNAIAIKAQ